MKDLSPIVLFVYNRPDLAMQTVESLQKNEQAKDSLLYIFSDGPRNEAAASGVEATRNYLKTIDGFKDVMINASPVNKGLGKSIITGVTTILEKHDSAIVLEDDLLSSPDYLTFMNEALQRYEQEKHVYSISGYMPPISLEDRAKTDVCFVPRISSWGWAIWHNRWQQNDWSISSYRDFIRDRSQKQQFSRAGADMLQMLINQIEGKANAWAIRCDYNRFLQGDKFTVYPCISKIFNIGTDGRGTNTPITNKLDVTLSDGSMRTILKDFSGEDKDITRNFYKFYNASWKSELIILLRRMGIYKHIKK